MTPPDTPIEPADEDQVDLPKPRSSRLGIILILVSGVLWLSLFAIPFLQLTTGQKTALAAGVFAAVQVTWWTGVTLSGPAAIQNMKDWFRGRRSR